MSDSRIVAAQALMSFKTGGIERLLQISVEPLRRQGVEPVVLSWRDDHPNLNLLTDQGVAHRRIQNSDWRYIRHVLKPGPEALEKLQAAQKELGFSILHGHHRWDPPVVASMARALGLPYVLTLHNQREPWETDGGFWPSFYRILMRRAYRGAEQVLCVSEAVKDNLENTLRWPVKRAKVVEIGVSDDTWNGADPTAERPYDIVMLGRLHPQKNMLFAMDVLAALRERRPGLRVAVLGEGPQRTEIEERISQNGLQGTVELMGHQPEGVVRLTCNQSKVFFAPSHFEGLSLAAVESLGLGLDAVVSTSTSFTKVFPNELGVRFCAPDDIQANMKALDETISNFRFRERPHLRQRFSIERYARELSETYREIARQAP